MFHLGARIPGKHPRLEGGGATGRLMKFTSVKDADAAKRDLVRVVAAWCDWRDEDAAPAKQRPSAKKKPAKR
jgi:hypothetical protein